MPDTWKNGEHVDHDPIVEARAAHLMGHQRRVARSAVAIQTGCRAACRGQTAADVLEARKALLLFLSVRTVVYEKGPVRFPFHKAQAVASCLTRGCTAHGYCARLRLHEGRIYERHAYG